MDKSCSDDVICTKCGWRGSASLLKATFPICDDGMPDFRKVLTCPRCSDKGYIFDFPEMQNQSKQNHRK